jgi:hypothetical protein
MWTHSCGYWTSNVGVFFVAGTRQREGRIGGRASFHSFPSSPTSATSLSYPAPEMSSHCLAVSAALTTGPSAPSAVFRFDGGEPRVAPEPENHAPETSADNATDTAEDPATSQKKGSFYSDKKGKFYSLEWPSIIEFDVWC